MESASAVSIKLGIPTPIVDGRVQFPRHLLESTPNQLREPNAPLRAGVLVMPEQLFEWARREIKEDAKAFAERLGLALPNDHSTAAGHGPRLSAVIVEWARQKGDRATTQHISAIKRSWQRFVKTVGDIRIDELLPEHFRSWHSWLTREVCVRGHSAQWFNDHAKQIACVLRQVKRRFPEWPWPPGILEWATGYDAQPHKPDDKNRHPITPELFKRLVGATKVLQTTNHKCFPVDTQSGRAKRLHSMRSRRDGFQLHAILHLAINCALDPVDIERIKWENIQLDTQVPHMRFARTKMTSRVGSPIQRITPLHANTVNALKDWQQFERHATGPVFRTASGGSYTRNRIAQSFNRLRRLAEVDVRWTFKHLRNVGPTLAKRAAMPRDFRDALLGHTVNGSSRFYEGDVDERYLLPLVKMIGDEYFDVEFSDATCLTNGQAQHSRRTLLNN